MAEKLTPVLIKDELSGEYVSYYEECMEVVSQGKTKEEALENLKIDWELVAEFKRSLNDNGKEV